MTGKRPHRKTDEQVGVGVPGKTREFKVTNDTEPGGTRLRMTRCG